MHALLVVAGVFWLDERRRRQRLAFLVVIHRQRIGSMMGPWRRQDPDFPGCVW